MKDVCIVIVTYNSEPCIADCLQSLESVIAKGAKVLCIDNNSSDNTRQITAGFDGVENLRNETNIGFSAACNQGIAQADCGMILFLNPDTVATENAIERLTDALRNAPENVIGAGPKLLLPYQGKNGESILDSAGIALKSEILSPHDRGHRQFDTGKYDSGEGYLGPSGACALYRKAGLLDIAIDGEIFDNDFFAYYEDVDLAWRARLFGYTFVFVPESVVFHDRKNPQAHSGAIRAQAFVNRYFLTIKNYHRLWDFFPGAWFYEFARFCRHTLKSPSFLAGWWHLIKYRRRMYKKRALIKARCKLTAFDMREFD